MSHEANLIVGLVMMAIGAALLYATAVIYPDVQNRINGITNHEGSGAQKERVLLLKTQTMHDNLSCLMYFMLVFGLAIVTMSGRQ